MPNKNRALYDQLKSEGYYTKSYDQFVSQFSNPDKLARLHDVMQIDGLYTKTVDDFKNQFFQLPDSDKVDYGVIPVKDTRENDSVTNMPVSDNNRLHANIDTDSAKEIVSKAKKHGVDPYTALAVAYQETGYSNEYGDNPFFVLVKNPDELTKFQKDPVDYSMQLMSDKNKYAKKLGKKSDEDIIQAWNGYGKVGGNNDLSISPIKKMYGVDVSKNPIDMNKNPVYGKRVIDIRDNILKKNPDIVKLVNETTSSQGGGQGTLDLPQ
jgi:hypothetical protein